MAEKSTKRVKGETSFVPLSLFQAFAMERKNDKMEIFDTR